MDFGPLRQRILQLAVSGQLVEQLDSEPAVEQVGPAPKPDEVPFELPAKWKWVQLEHLFSMQAGKFIKASLINDEGLYPCYGGNGLRGYVDNFNVSGTFNLIGRQGALCGNVHLVSGDFYATEHAVVAKHSEAIDPRCAYYFLTALNLNQYATATAQPGLAVSRIKKVFYPLAPLEEQRRIVAVVDGLMGRLDQMEAAYSEFAGPMTEHFRNLMLDKAIRGELVPQLDSEPEVEQVGPAPKPDEVPFELPPKWKWVPIKALFSMHSGKFIKAALVLDEGTYPCYGGNGIRGYTESFNTEGVCNIIGRVGAQCGNVHLAKGKYYVTDNAIVATHCDRIDPMCANLFLKALNLKQYATATAQPLLNVSTIGKLYYPLAPIEEQRRIVAKLDEVFTGVEKLGSLMEYA